MATNEPYPGTQAVLRALALLKAFTDEQPELSLAALAELAQLNKTTAYRLLTALESEGMIARSSEAEAYRLGPEAIALGGRAMRANDLRAITRPELEAMAQATRETATIEVLCDGQVLTLDEISGSHLVGAAQTVGSQWPLHATSTGKVLLAHLPAAELELFLQAPLARFTPQTLTDPAALRQQLAAIAAQGYAVAAEELEVGFVAVGAPVRNHDGRVVAALSIGGPSARFTSDRVPEFARLVTQAAGRISARLGYKQIPVSNTALE